MRVGDLERRWQRRERLLAALYTHLVAGPRGSAYRWLTVAWALAVAARLTLVESLQPSWMLPSLALIVGSLGLLVWGGRLFWLASAIGLAVPLFFLRDWLTQTVIMLLIALVGLATVRRPGSERDEAQTGAAAPILAAARWLVVITYVVAAFHKLNRGFFEPGISCANELIVQLAELFPGGAGVDAAALGFLPTTAIVVELGVPAALALRPRLGVALGLAFHLPLTLAFAPAFVFVMLIGYVAWLGEDDRDAFVAAWRSHWRWLLALGAAVVAIPLALMADPPVVDLAVKLLLLALVLGLALVVWFRDGLGRRPTRLSLGGWERCLLGLISALFIANAATPYLGTQFQHAGAMLSNLRIDAGCWNHFLIPEAVRVVDAYVRVDQASVGVAAEDGSEPFGETEALLESRLWSTVALRLMRRNWCSDRTRPIRLEGTFLGAPLRIADLCDRTEALPVGPGVWGGSELFLGYLRFQKGLARECSQACLH